LIKKNILLLIFLLNAVLFAGDSKNIHFWQATKFNKTLSDKFAMTLEQDLRTESSLFYAHSDIGFKYKINTKFTLNINFREVFEKKDGVWVSEHRPHGTISTKMKLGNFNISARSRIEYRLKQNKDAIFRNRDMITLKSGREFTSFKLIPYIADEIFYDFEKKELNRNRAYIGFSIKSFQSFTPTVYLMKQSNYKENAWSSFIAMGMKINF
jgi:hypothetical protein